MRFENQVVLVTGAVRNTGLAIAEAFAREGAIVALNGRKPEDVARQADRLRSTYRANVIEVPADVAQPDQVAAMFATLQNTHGHLEVLVNNAIVQGVGHTLVDTPHELLEQVFRVNVFGSYDCAQHAARMMLKQGHGAIVNVGSNTAQRAIQNRTAYIASKGAIDALTRAMAVELGPKGIRVNCVAPGYIHTPRWDELTDAQTQRRRDNLPLGQEAVGDEVADAVLFMASDAAAKITGTHLVVDGGCLAQCVPPDADV